MIPVEWLAEADTRIDPHIHRTPLTYDTARDLYLKWDDHQVTGSFKARGALNKVLTLQPWEREMGLVTASAGNHGQGVALAAEVLRAEPKTAHATWVVPVGGGGLLVGISSVLREQAGPALRSGSAQARVVGVQVSASAFMHGLYYRGTQDGVADLPTLADGLAGAVEEDSITVPVIESSVDEIILLSEEEIGRAVAFVWHEYGVKVEGAGAVGLAAILTNKVTHRPAVIVITGGIIQPEVHQEIIDRS